MSKKTVSLITLLMLIGSIGQAGFNTEPSRQIKYEKVIKIVCEKIDRIYPDKSIALKVIQGLTENLYSGKYKKNLSAAAFASAVTEDMETLSQDKHLDLFYDPARVAAMREQEEKGSEAAYLASSIEQERMNNFGFKELKILEGNIGYLDLRVFFAAKYAGDTASAAMNFFANCDAMVIDLRKNGGGWDGMVNLLLSYFIDPEEEVVLKVTRSTIDESYYPSMTLPYLPGKKYDKIPLYILTSESTASAAEAFIFRMKQLNKHVVTVGSRTAGAENPISFQILDDDFILQIPSYQVVYSATDGGWEGKGIKPDIEAKSDEALDAAYLDALKKLREAATDKLKLGKYQWAIDGIEAIRTPYVIDKAVLGGYAGKYGRSLVSLDDGFLYYTYKNRPKRKLIPIAEDYFLVEGVDHYRIRFERQDGSITSLTVIFNDGYKITSSKES
ncbi:MAG: S41 family peptidase [Candidatus Aminicenantaceae bacterium]